MSLSLFVLCVSYHMINLLDIPSLCTVKRNEYLLKNIFYLINHLYIIGIYCCLNIFLVSSFLYLNKIKILLNKLFSNISYFSI